MMQLQPTGNNLPLPQLVAVMFERTLSRLMAHLEVHGYDDIRATHVLNVFLHLQLPGRRSGELAALARMTAQSMGELIDYLEQRRYVMRVPDPADGRAKLVIYAERGLEAARSLEGFYADLENEWIDAIGQDQGTTLKSAMNALVGEQTHS